MSTSIASVEQVRRELRAGAHGLATNARRLVRWRAAMLWCTLLLLVLGLLVLADTLLRREEIGLRVLSAVTLLGAAGWAAYRILAPAWSFAPTSIQVAQWIERHRPELGDQLSTMVQLADVPTGDARFGSSQFRDSAFRNWAAEGFHPNWRSYLDTGHWWRTVARLALVAALLVSGVAMWPEESLLGLKRLLMPWASAHWPRKDQLELYRPPTAIALGTELQLEIIDLNPPLPDSVDVWVRSARNGELLSVLGTTSVGELAIANLPPVEDAIEVRATGGDDDTMDWTRIDVVRPPEVEQYRYSIDPPEYTGRESIEIVGKKIQVLARSRVRLFGILSEPVRQLSLNRFEPGDEWQDPAADDWSITLGGDRRSFVLGAPDGQPWQAERSLSWKLVVTTEDDVQIALPDLWSVDVVHDAPPRVVLRDPVLFEISAVAQLPLVGKATDDLGLERLTARVSLADRPVDPELSTRPEEQHLPSTTVERVLWELRPEEKLDPQAAQRDRNFDESWDFSRDLEVVEGQSMTVWIEARDTFGQIGRSAPQTFVVRPSENLFAAIQDRQRQVLQRLNELVDSQRRNMQLATRTAEITERSGRVEQETLDALSSVAQVQASIRRQFSEGRSSLKAEIEAIVEVIAQNRLSDSEQASELRWLSDHMERIAETVMPTTLDATFEAEQKAKTTLDDGGQAGREAVQAMQQSSTAQLEVLQQLQSLLDRMAQAEAAQQVQRELVQIEQQQRQLRRETDRLQLLDVSGADVERSQSGLAADQQGVARQLDDLVMRIRDLQQSGNEETLSRQRNMERAADTLIGRQASNLMRQAADDVHARQWASAASSQEEILEVLREARVQLHGGALAAGSLTERADYLRRTGEALSDLADKQSELAESLRAGMTSEDMQRTAEEQASIRQSTAEQTQRLQEEGDVGIADDVERASQSQADAERALQDQEESQAAEAAADAAEKLADAADAAMRRSQELASEVQQEQLFQLSRALTELIAQQEPVVGQIASAADRIDGSLADANPQNEQTGRDLAARQEAIRQVLRDVRGKTDSLPAFDWTLEQTDGDMSRAVAAARRFRLAPEALDAATAALTKLTLAAAALENASSADSQSTGGDESNADSEPDRDDARMVPPIASLKLLRGLQADIHERTRLLDASASSEPARASRLEALARQQQALGEQVEKLLREMATSNEGKP